MNTWPSQILIGLSKTCSAIGIQTWILLSMRRWKKKWKNNHNNSNQSPKALHEWLMNLPLSSKTTCIVAWFLPNPCNDHHHIWHEAHRRLVHVPQQELLPRQQLVIHLSHALLEVGLAEILWPTGPKTPFESVYVDSPGFKCLLHVQVTLVKQDFRRNGSTTSKLGEYPNIVVTTRIITKKQVS